MRNYYLRLLVLFIVFAGITLPGHAGVNSGMRVILSDTTRIIATISTKITDTRVNRPAFLKNGVMVNFVPFKPSKEKVFAGSPKTVRPSESDKVLNNVTVYPNPVADNLNLKYSISKDATVVVKIMDVLGNEVTTLLTERLSSGDQLNSFNIASRLNSGFYFIRVSVSGETVTKRISVL